MAIKAKNKNETNNILYLQDADAKALGIIEGSAQRVFIDNKEVEVVFVDEHEVIPVSNEDKKIYQEAYKIAAKYADAANMENSPAWNSLVSRSADARRTTSESSNSVFREKWEGFKGLFSKKQRTYGNEANFSYDDELASNGSNVHERTMVKYRKPIDYSNDRYEAQRRHAKHSIRNDVFTKEELEIIQNVIDKSKNYNNRNVSASASMNANNRAPIKRTTNTKVKTATKKK